MNFADPEIKTHPELFLAGHSLEMSFSDNKTFQLWNQFMPERKKIPNQASDLLYSLQEYSPEFFTDFRPEKIFRKYALVPVIHPDQLPDQFISYRIQEGLYAVFHYKGNPANAKPFYDDIFRNWLPRSSYELDHRPHFEILGPAFKYNSDDSEEEIWIPVIPR